MLASICVGYASGSIPTAIWIARWVGNIDIRRHGSGNAGATNVARVLGTKWGLLVGVVDVLKGFLPVLLLKRYAADGFGTASDNSGLFIGAAAILGHLFPLFAGFRGGKGVLTALGVFTALLPLEASISALIWAAVFWRTRIVSLSSIIAVLCLPVLVVLRGILPGLAHTRSLQVASALIAALVIYTHRSNIRRLLSGEETPFGGPR